MIPFLIRFNYLVNLFFKCHIKLSSYYIFLRWFYCNILGMTTVCYKVKTQQNKKRFNILERQKL